MADGGASIFAETVRQTRSRVPQCRIEVLIPDFKGEPAPLYAVLDAEPDVILRMPGDSPAPLLLTIGLSGALGALVLHRWWVAAAFTLAAALAVLVWLWPEVELGQVRRGEEGAYA